MGRPSIFTPELGATICDRIVAGESLRSILRDEAMPAWGSVWRWLRDNPDFAAQYARAKEEQADTLADEIVDIADETTGDPVRDRLRVDARKWVAAKLKPKKYGEAQLIKHADADGNKIQAVVNLSIAAP